MKKKIDISNFEDGVSKVGDSIRELGIALGTVFTPLSKDVKQAMFNLHKAINNRDWENIYCERNEWESHIEWGNRLQVDGYLDNPDIRWYYQVETAKWIVSPITSLWDKGKDYAESL